MRLVAEAFRSIDMKKAAEDQINEMNVQVHLLVRLHPRAVISEDDIKTITSDINRQDHFWPLRFHVRDGCK